jgi:crotonobetainyl-CoA:carnitine CoA-transferase CaiB-like acyl-CoA transferase
VLLRPNGTPSYRPKVDRGQHGFGPAYRLYETQSAWIQVAAVRDAEWRALCAVLGVPEGVDRWTAEIQLEVAFRTKTALQWSHLLDDAGVPNEVSFDAKGGEEALYDSDAERLGLVVEYEHPIMGRLRQFGELVNFSDTPARVYGPPPRVGEHTLEILEWLRRGDDADKLKAAGVVYWPDDGYAWSW